MDYSQRAGEVDIFCPNWRDLELRMDKERRPTVDKKPENGNPLSRANDQICRDAVAISLTTAKTKVMIMIAVIVFVPAWLPVML